MTTWYRRLLLAAALAFAAPSLAQTTCAIKDGSGAPISVRCPNPDGRAAAAASAPMVLSTEDKAAVDLLHTDNATAAAKQPALNADGGTPAHVTNFPAANANGRAAAAASAPTALSTEDKTAIDLLHSDNATAAAKQPALNADGGTPAHVTNFPAANANGRAAAAASAPTALSTEDKTAIDLLHSDNATAAAKQPALINNRLPTVPIAATDVTTSATIDATTINSAATVTPNGQPGLGIDVGTMTGGVVLQPQEEVTVGGPWTPTSIIAAGTGFKVTSITAGGSFFTTVAAKAAFRLTVTTAGTGTVGVTYLNTAQANIIGVSCGDYARCLATVRITDGIGGMLAVPAGTANGTAIGTAPAGSRGVRLYLAASDTVTFTIATTAPGAPPTATYTVSGASAGTGPNWDESLAAPAMLYVTAVTGSPKFRWF